MPAPNPHTIEQIRLAGKAEFLDKGYAQASMRSIAKKAGVTTGAIYGYFPDKASLFRDLVKGPAQEIMLRFQQAQEIFHNKPPETKALKVRGYATQTMDALLEYIYEHLDVFKLIVKSSAGTEYEDYVDKLVAIEEKYTHLFMASVRRMGQPVPELSPDVVHLLCSANFHGIFQVVAHDIPKQEALGHIKVLTRFYTAGWNRILNLNG